MVAELIAKCENQGMTIVSWASWAEGDYSLLRRVNERLKSSMFTVKGVVGNRARYYSLRCDLKEIFNHRKCSLQAVALAYLYAQSTYVSPIVGGVQTVDHVKAMTGARRIKLSEEEVDQIISFEAFQTLVP